MPIYEYVCDVCKFEFEAFILASRDEDEVECPKCGATNVSRMLSPFSRCAGSAGGTGGVVPSGGFS